MKAHEVMNPMPLLFRSDQTIGQAARILLDQRVNAALLLDDSGHILGIVNKDLLMVALAEGLSAQTKLGELLYPPLQMMDYNQDIPYSEDNQNTISVVVKDGAIAGLIDRGEINARYAMRERHRTAETFAIIDAVSTPVIAIDKDGIINLFNKWASRFLKINAGEALGQKIDEVINNHEIVEILYSPELITASKIMLGESTFVPFCKNVVKDQEIVGRVLVLRDVSELEQVLRESEYISQLNRELEAIIESSFDGLYVTDGFANTLRLNKGFERIMGIYKEQCVGRNMAELVEDGVFSRSGTLLALEKKERVTISLVASTGKEALVTSTPIFDEEGNVILVVTNVRDITELNELQRKLDQMEGLREREMEAVIESSFDGLYVTDGEANTLRLNKGFERIMGVNAAECVGKNMEELVANGIFSRSGTLLALQKREPVTITLVSKTGKEALVTSNPIFDEEGNIIMVVTNVRDITELNDLQRRLEHMESLRQFYETELQQLKLATSHNMVVNSDKMKEVVNLALRIANVDSTVLIQGESGVGKELIAGLIHSSSNRKNGPFIKVNCGAIPENLLESELFGYEAGAFTGAHKDGKMGFFELAEGGVLFLDEIGELPLNLQVKLLRALQDREIVRVGGVTPIKVDIRILAGTNRNLAEMIDNKQFRLDLFYRLNVIPINVPPLRERLEDIPMLANYFLNFYNNKYALDKRIDNSVMEKLLDYSWPGNVRELENLIERLVITSVNNIISLRDLQPT
ncbi:sigma 54-interacting transcriptional regulator [Syntrophomonas palmitatica]|uniref:sigma 54-interacting transcriptional regulator n=1 Tax=Syntrophomonas palmitatica TaxID=402877 RepID=UPI0006D1F201|nr:sigma 54-interacting transcriptional regulator [Syntrophomonas palmitatica]